jgi:hypothetical protein
MEELPTIRSQFGGNFRERGFGPERQFSERQGMPNQHDRHPCG